MAIINLRRYYPHYRKDKFVEVPDEVAAALEERRRAELESINLAVTIIQICPVQPQRPHARYVLKKKFHEITANEEISGSCPTTSVAAAVDKLQKFFIKNGWMPKEV